MSRNSVNPPEYYQHPVLKVSEQMTETSDLPNRESFKSPLMPFASFGKCIEYIECFKDALNEMFISLFSDLTMKNLSNSI